MSVFVETRTRKLRVFVGFVDFKFKICCEFRSLMFLNHSKWITSCFDGLNIPSYLAYSTFLVITNRDFYGLVSPEGNFELTGQITKTCWGVLSEWNKLGETFPLSGISTCLETFPLSGISIWVDFPVVWHFNLGRLSRCLAFQLGETFPLSGISTWGDFPIVWHFNLGRLSHCLAFQLGRLSHCLAFQLRETFSLSSTSTRGDFLIVWHFNLGRLSHCLAFQLGETFPLSGISTWGDVPIVRHFN